MTLGSSFGLPFGLALRRDFFDVLIFELGMMVPYSQIPRMFTQHEKTDLRLMLTMNSYGSFSVPSMFDIPKTSNPRCAILLVSSQIS